MFTRPFRPDRFLKAVYGTQALQDFCDSHQILFEQVIGFPPHPEDTARWTAALAQLSAEQHAQVEYELAKANELADRSGSAHLLEAAHGLPLPPDDVPGEAPLALWFLVHHPTLFHEVFLRYQIEEIHSWRTAQVQTGITLQDLQAVSAPLATSLQVFFQKYKGTGRFCKVEAYRLETASCFIAQVSDRLQFLESFSDDGDPMTQRLRPALPILFVCEPEQGTVLLKSHLRSRDRILELFQCFGEAVLQLHIDERCLGDAFDLDLLKHPFHPLPDAPDMERIRLKALHFRYPVQWGRRQIKLETLLTDEPSAIEHLLRRHVTEPGLLEVLQVSYAELEVTLRVEGRSKIFLLRLWPNRCNLNHTPLGERFRSCLRHWGLLPHAA